MPWTFTGPANVAIADLAYVDPSIDLGSDGPPFDKHLVGRIFYPTGKQVKGNRWPLLGHRGESWLPGSQYSVGLAKFLFFRRPKGLLYSVAQSLITGIISLLGKQQKLDLHPGAPLATPADTQHPVVVFSHGLAGMRSMYSVVCGELASQGYVVLAVEHADGSSCCVRLADGRYVHYGGLGDEEKQVQKLRDRVQEMKTARRVLESLAQGEPLPGVQLSHKLDAASFLRGKLDFSCLAAVGHSYGGATVAALTSEDPAWAAAIALDPWWYALPAESAALNCWRTGSPLMVQPSHDWSVPNMNGELACGGERQAAVLAAARGDGGGGCLRLVLAGSSHNSYADPLPLFSSMVGWLLDRLGLTARLDPQLGVFLSIAASLAFLSTHLPLSREQRDMQNWYPTEGGGILARVQKQDKADRGEAGGLFSGVLPGKGVLNAVSDWLLNRSLSQAGRARANGGRAEPEDVGSAVEVAETMLPSADPASGKHPHAPSRRTDSVDLGAALAAEQRVARRQSSDAGQRRELRARVGSRYAKAVTEEDARELEALLGQEHIYQIDC